ncbi:TlpA disulfide reductase family protein [Candidatus Laterigemmans baculatus]|uniref:TlpA disulfide reductase family protein n=1 Tax=Candidatus Laterigemmans baculatus TaxID=2770505 RepID=UPI0013DC797B|nr:TlpA disulfide reductase family protein [Candidatus Laterigemmans baculatus]
MHKRRLLAATLLAGATAFGLSVGGAVAADEAPKPSAADALALKPVQANVEYAQPAAADLAGCRVELLDKKGWSGWVVLDASGRRLRQFVDTNDDLDIDLWCYYQDGIEVYRDVDADFNGKADQYRWLGTAGTRWGLDENEDGKIDRWKRISAEEATAELVAAIAESDPQRFARLLLSSEELESLGLDAEAHAQLEDKLRKAKRDFPLLVRDQKAIGPKSRWAHFTAGMPGTIPAGTAAAGKEDVTAYENAVAMFEANGETGQLLVGTIVQVGPVWRLVDLPQLPGDQQALASTGGFFFSGANLAVGEPAPVAGGMTADVQKLVSELEKVDSALRTASGDAAAKLHDQRADVLEGIIAASDPAQRASWIRQLVDTVAAAVQENAYPGGLERLRGLAKKLGAGDEELQAYVQYQILSVDYAQRLQKVESQSDFPKVQEWWLGALEGFVEEYAGTPEAAQGMLQLALSKEFEDDEKAALVWYTKVARGYRDTDAGRKAAGAVRRLESVGRELPLTGTTLDNKAFDLARLRGKPVVIHYWATWCEPCKQDMKLLRQLQARYQKAGLQIVGINVDGVRSDAIAYLNEVKLPWVTLFAEGGLDASPLANMLGVQTLPTMLLVDAQGKVVRHNITASQLDEEIDKLVRAGK